MKSAKPSPVVGVPLLLGDIYNFILGRVPGYEIVMTSHCFKKKSFKNQKNLWLSSAITLIDRIS